MLKREFFSWIFLGVVLEVYALLGVFIELKGSDTDSGRFHDSAIEWVSNGTLVLTFDAAQFVQFLGLLYRYSFENVFWASQFSVLSVLATFYLMVKTLRHYRIRFPLWGLFFVFINPIAMPRLATVMREPYLLLGMMLFVYLFLCKKSVLRSSFVFIITATLHKAFLAALPAVCLVLLFFERATISSFLRLFSLRNILLALLFVGLLYGLGQNFFDNRGLRPLMVLLDADSGVLLSTMEYKNSVDGGAQYAKLISGISLNGLVYPVIYNFIHYMFGPFPHEFKSALYLPVALISYVRAFIFLQVIRNLKRLSVANYKLFAIYLVVVIVWSFGTVNYGTASRHHVTTDALLLMIYLLSMKKRQYV